jgi:hypothetical protein
MSDVHLANSPEARTETGEIKDVTTPQPTETTTTPATPETKTETKPAETKTSGPETKPSLVNEKSEGDKKAAATGAPEKYEPFKVPEGHEIDEKEFKEVTELFKGMNLSQEQGQKLIDKYVATNQEAFDAPYKAWNDLQEKWIADVKADPDIGHRIPEVKATIGKALDTLGDPKLAASFREAMDLTGAGNNPAFVKAFWKLAQQVTEGGHVAGTGPSPHGQRAPGQGAPTAAKALYPNLP